MKTDFIPMTMPCIIQTIIQVALGFLVGLAACFVGLMLIKPQTPPQFVTVDIAALTKSRLVSLAQADLPEQDKIADMRRFEKALSEKLNNFVRQRPVILFNKPAVIASSIPMEDITEALSKVLPPNSPQNPEDNKTKQEKENKNENENENETGKTVNQEKEDGVVKNKHQDKDKNEDKDKAIDLENKNKIIKQKLTTNQGRDR